MPTLIETYDLTQILQPVQRPEDARQDAVKWGPSLTITKGMAFGIKTSDGLAYPFVSGASDGTQVFQGFAMMSFLTDASSNVFYGPTAAASFRTGPWKTSAVWVAGIFDPADLSTTTQVAQVDTFTAGGTITAGDVYTVTLTGSAGETESVTFTVGGTATATAVADGLRAAITAAQLNGNSLFQKVVASGTATLILTAATAGQGFTSSKTVVGVGTFTRVATTANAGFVLADIQTSRPDVVKMHNGFIRVPG